MKFDLLELFGVPFFYRRVYYCCMEEILHLLIWYILCNVTCVYVFI